MAIADELDGLLVDLDGVVWLGRVPVPGAAETLRALQAAGKEIVFITNNPGREPEVYAQRLAALGVDVGADRVLTAGVATARLAAGTKGMRRALVIGAPAFHGAARDAGLDVVESGDDAVDAVLVSSHRGFDYGELLAATRALQGGASLFATSRDPTMPMPGGAWPGTGAVLAAVETASGRTAQVGGKPEPRLFEEARRLIPGAARVAMVGDRVSSDIAGAKGAGLGGILVLTGAGTREEAAASETPPDHVLDDLAGLL